MKAGQVIRMRLTPSDCMAVADILGMVGVSPASMSMSGAASLALTVAFEELRSMGKIPRRFGYEYNELMQQFSKSSNMKEKLAKTNQIYHDAMRGARVTLSGVVPAEADTPTETSAAGDLEREVTPLSEAELAKLEAQLNALESDG